MATFTFFNLWKEAQLDGGLANTPIDFDGDDIRLALVTNSNIPDAATDDMWDDLQATEVSGGGYTAGGVAIATKLLTESGGTVTFNADDVTWSQNGTGFTTARFAILYSFNATPANAPMIGFINFTADKGNVSGDLTVQWNVSGIFTMA